MLLNCQSALGFPSQVAEPGSKIICISSQIVYRELAISSSVFEGRSSPSTGNRKRPVEVIEVGDPAKASFRPGLSARPEVISTFSSREGQTLALHLHDPVTSSCVKELSTHNLRRCPSGKIKSRHVRCTGHRPSSINVWHECRRGPLARDPCIQVTSVGRRRENGSGNRRGKKGRKGQFVGVGIRRGGLSSPDHTNVGLKMSNVVASINTLGWRRR